MKKNLLCALYLYSHVLCCNSLESDDQSLRSLQNQPGGPGGQGGVNLPINGGVFPPVTGGGGVTPPITGGGGVNPSLPVLSQILTTPLNTMAEFERRSLLSSGTRYIGFPTPSSNTSPCIVLGLYRFIALQGGVANTFEIRASSNSKTLPCRVTATLFEFPASSSNPAGSTTPNRVIGAIDAIALARPELLGSKPGTQVLSFPVLGKNWKLVSGKAYGIALLTSTYAESSRTEFCSVSIPTAADYNVTSTSASTVTIAPDLRGYLQTGSASPSANSAANNGICISSINAFYAPPAPRLLKLDGYHLIGKITAIDTTAAVATVSPSPSVIPVGPGLSDKIGTAASVSPPAQQDSSSSSIFVYIYAIAGGVAGAFILGMAFVYALMRNAAKSPISSIDTSQLQQTASADELDPRMLDPGHEWGSTPAPKSSRHQAVEIASGQRPTSARTLVQPVHPRVVVNPLQAQYRASFSPQGII